MATVDVLRTIKIRAQTEGAAESEAALNRVRVATKNLDASNEEAAKSMTTNERAIKSLLRSYEEGYSATEKLTKIQKDLSIGVAAGRVSIEQAAAIYDVASDKILGLTRATEMEAMAAAKSAAANEALRAKYDLAFASARKLAAAVEEIATAERDAGLSRELAIAAVQKETQAYNAQITTLERLAIAGKDAAKRTVINSGSYQPASNRGADIGAYGDALDRLQAEFDPVFAAVQKYDAYLERLDMAHRVGAISVEVMNARLAEAVTEHDAYIAKLTGTAQAVEVLTAAQERNINAEGKLRAIRMVQSFSGYVSARDRGADIDAYAEEMNALQREFDPAFAALDKYNAYLDRLDRAQRVGAISTEVMTARLHEATAAYEAERDRINGVVAAVESLTAAEERNLLVKGKLDAIRIVTSDPTYRRAQDRGADVEAAFGEGGAFDTRRAKYDEMFAATQQYKAGLSDLRAARDVGAVSPDVYRSNIQEMKADFNARRVELGFLSKAERDAAQAAKEAAETTAAADAKRAASAQQWKNLTGSVPVDANANASRALGSLSYSKEGLPAMSSSAQAERAALLPMAAAEQDYAAKVARSEAALRAKVITETEHNSVVAMARGTLQNQTNEFNKATAAAERNTKGTGLNAYAWTNLSYQINDVVTSLGSGISPMQTLAQQGGQIFQILQSDEGGVVGGLKSIKDAMLGLMTPARLVFGGIASLAIGAAYSLYRYQSDMASLRNQTGGIGRATGATVGGINALAPAAGDAAGISIRSAREIAGAFAATGEIGVGMYVELTKVTKDFSKATGEDLTIATKEIATAFASPVAGATALNAKLGFLTRSTYEAIRAAEEQGQVERARRILLDSVADATAKAQDKLGLFTRGWETLKKLTSDTVDGVGSTISAAFGIDEAEDKLKRLLATPRVSDSYLFGDNKVLDANIAKARAAVEYAKQQGETIFTNQQGLKIGTIVDHQNPQLRAVEQMEGKAKTIREEFERLKISNPFGPAYDTMMGLERAAKQIRSDMEAGGASYADSLRNAQFQNKTVGFSDYGRRAAEIDENAKNRGIAANREFQANNNGDAYAKALTTIEKERLESLEALNKATKLAETNLGANFGKMNQTLQGQILEAGKLFGKVPPSLIAAIGGHESTSNPNVGYSKILGEDGRPSSAYGLGQITKGTADEAVKLGYLPSGFDRMNPTTMAQGIAGVLAMKIDQAGGNEAEGIMNYRGSKSRAVNQAYLADIRRRQGKYGDVSEEGQAKDTDERAQALKTLNEQLENNKKYYGESGLLLEANNKAIAEYNAKTAQGVKGTDELKRSIESYAMATVTAAQQQKLNTYQKDAAFERSQLGRTTEDAAAYSKARGMFGDTSSEASKIVIETEKLNDNLKFTRDLGKEAFSGFTSDLSKGVGVFDALGNAFGRFADKIISRMSDKAFTMLFDSILGGGSGSGGGLLSSLFGGGGSGGLGSGGIDVGAQGWMPKFAGGGVSNRPSIFGEAGPEAAVPLPDGRRIPVMLSQPANSNSGVKVTVNNTQSQTTDAQVSEGPNGEVMIDIVDKGLARKTSQNRSAIQRAAGGSLRG